MPNMFGGAQLDEQYAPHACTAVEAKPLPGKKEEPVAGDGVRFSQSENITPDVREQQRFAFMASNGKWLHLSEGTTHTGRHIYIRLVDKVDDATLYHHESHGKNGLMQARRQSSCPEVCMDYTCIPVVLVRSVRVGKVAA